MQQNDVTSQRKLSSLTVDFKLVKGKSPTGLGEVSSHIVRRPVGETTCQGPADGYQENRISIIRPQVNTFQQPE